MGRGEQPADRRRVGDLTAKIMATASSRSTQATSSSASPSVRSKRSSDGTSDSDRARNSRIVSLLKPGFVVSAESCASVRPGRRRRRRKASIPGPRLDPTHRRYSPVYKTGLK
jgi:hypothetical protein